MQPLLLILCFSLHIFNTATGASWCYNSQTGSSANCLGPDDWKKVNTQCDGTKQSPIDIDTKTAIYDDQLIPFQFHGYETPYLWNLTNDGHSAKMIPNGNLWITGGNLSRSYKVQQLHLHWGDEQNDGAEHTINKERNPMELHIVHMSNSNAKQDDAMEKPGGLAVLGFLYKKDDSDSANENYKPFIDALKKIPFKGNIISLDKLQLNSIIPELNKLSRYYRYEGSLTTPNCSEGVIWTIFEETIPLSKTQLRTFFQNLYFPPSGNEDPKHMSMNHRPTQNFNQRKLYTSNGEAVLPQCRVLLTTVLIIFFMTFVCC
ncbi:carbonic anhydrase 4 [Microcaecilia unicolor]|uniref:Carbonic anhydrase 4 n=1 Tax=Microcaecilia unicolor TaxID=1415580 RepID=A0A6P7WLH0_9AMPH|nr:carbonic anhydrase 4 [Microcaecilia unicolor]